MLRTSNENQLNLAFQAIQQNPSLNIRCAASIYTINYIILFQRKRNIPSSYNYVLKTHNFTDLKKKAIIYQILELNAQRFFLKLQDMEDITNKLRHNRNTFFIKKNWISIFISCHLEFKTTFSHKYDYQRTLCKNSKIINK